MFTFTAEMRFIKNHIAIQLSWIIMFLVILNCTMGASKSKHQDIRNFHGCSILTNFLTQVAQVFLSLEGFNDNNSESDFDKNTIFSLIEVNESPESPLIERFIFVSHQIVISKVTLYKELYKAHFYPELTPPPPKFS
jgi:hypothetical protein